MRSTIPPRFGLQLWPQQTTWPEFRDASLAAEASLHVSPVPAVDPETLIMGVVALRRQRELRALELERDRVAALTGTTPAVPRGFPAR